MLLNYCTQYISKCGKQSRGHRTGKGQFSFQYQIKTWPKNVMLISHVNKVMLKILQVSLQLYVNCESQMYKQFGKDRVIRDQIANICWIMRKQEYSRKLSTSTSLTMPKLLTVWITTNCGKFLKKWEYQTTLPAS